LLLIQFFSVLKYEEASAVTSADFRRSVVQKVFFVTAAVTTTAVTNVVLLISFAIA